MILGPRLGKFRRDGTVRATPPSNILVVTLGVLILWLGWFGFNGGSVLELGTAKAAVTMGHVLVNTNLAAAAGVMAALLVSRPILGRIDLFAGLNGALAGLVSITAGPDIVDHYWAVVIGAAGGGHLYRRDQASRNAQAGRRGGSDSRSPVCRYMGDDSSIHRRRRHDRCAADRCCGDWSVRVRHFVDSMEGARSDARNPGIARCRGTRTGRPENWEWSRTQSSC